jgi:hypothetical protein
VYVCDSHPGQQPIHACLERLPVVRMVPESLRAQAVVALRPQRSARNSEVKEVLGQRLIDPIDDHSPPRLSTQNGGSSFGAPLAFAVSRRLRFLDPLHHTGLRMRFDPAVGQQRLQFLRRRACDQQPTPRMQFVEAAVTNS